MSKPLIVCYQQRLVGRIAPAATGIMEFSYDDTWRKSTDGFPISLSLPLDGAFSALASHHFFANLLPEGSVREQICKSLQISPQNDCELLRAIGGDCAGALTIGESPPSGQPLEEARYKPVTAQQLAIWSSGTPSAFSGVTGHNQVRLSLAGAQDKLPVHLDGDQILVPLQDAPSTFILKFPSAHYAHLPENEAFVTMLAREVGLPTVDVQVRKTGRASVSLIERYDRRFESGRWRRLHQEDFCQALGINAAHKYEKEGGPSLQQCANILRQHSAYPLLDLQKLLQWTCFNLFAGNADAHGKNLSLLYSDTRVPTLAPFYDLVCTRNYKNLSRELAMQIGGAWNPDMVTTAHLKQLAEELGFRAKFVLEQATTISARMLAALPTVQEQFRSRFRDSPVLERLPIIIRKQIRRVKSQCQ